MKTFSELVVKIARSIPPGRVTTYGRIARAAGGGGVSARSITSILGKAYDSGMRDIPFHRIVYADGRAWFSENRRAERMRLYKKEGIEIGKYDKIKNFRDILLEYE